MSKLDRFLVSENLLISCPSINAISLDRYISDHRPILLREVLFDYGPIPFRFYNYWLEKDGFDKLVMDAWNDAPGNKRNAIRNFMCKLKFTKERIRVQLFPAVGVIAFAAWGHGPLSRAYRILFKQKNDNTWTKSKEHRVMTSYIQPLLLWGVVVLICSCTEPATNAETDSTSTTFIDAQLDEYSCTSVPSIWVVGDVTDKMNLTPVAFSAIPSTLFSQPPIGQVSLSEQQVTVVPAITIDIFLCQSAEDMFSMIREQFLLDEFDRNVVGSVSKFDYTICK
ncbi:RNA-directed DNA polymerase, eukaryota [Tanacetum coccineum]